jgi:hypothetical protein
MPGKLENSTKTTIYSEIAEILLQERWKKMDMHVHSSCSYDVPPTKTMHPKIIFRK